MAVMAWPYMAIELMSGGGVPIDRSCLGPTMAELKAEGQP